MVLGVSGSNGRYLGKVRMNLWNGFPSRFHEIEWSFAGIWERIMHEE